MSPLVRRRLLRDKSSTRLDSLLNQPHMTGGIRHGAFPNSALTTLNSTLKDRDAKAELNRRSQACEVLTGTGVRVAENEGLSSEALAKEDRASGYRALY